MISDIRNYFSQIINEVNSDLRFDGYVFDTEKIGVNALDSTYKMVIGSMATESIETWLQSQIPVTIVIYSHSTLDFADNFDESYNDAICIQAACCNKTKVDQLSFIKSITTNGINVSPMEGDDNFMRFEISFNVLVSYFDNENI